jgi:hypothetical protein
MKAIKGENQIKDAKKKKKKEQERKRNPLLLGYDTGSLTNWFPNFRNNVTVSPSRVDISMVEMDILTLNTKSVRCVETPESKYLEELILQLYHCEILSRQTMYAQCNIVARSPTVYTSSAIVPA